MCHVIFITSEGLKILNLYSETKDFIEKTPFNEEEIFIKRCTDEPEIINLTSYNLTKIKNHFSKSTYIRSVSLRDNKLQDIPSRMLKNLVYLNCLILSQNEINIYEGFSIKHDFISILDLSLQKPSKTYAFSVETFDENSVEIENNYKKIIFDSSNIWLPNLIYLDLSDNAISTLTEDFRLNFPKLTHLYLDNINALTVDSFLFSNLLPKSLRCLSLKDNKISDFNFNNSATIVTLYLDQNPLQNVSIISYTLKTLSLSNCKNLNNVYLNTPYLEYLDMSKNNINVLTEFLITGNNYVITSSLKTLILDYNKFTHLPLLTGFHKLTELSLNYNMIKTIPENAFANLQTLEKLQIKGNKLHYIDANTFIGLSGLKYLDLSDNNLEILHDKWILPLVNLKYLNANTNKFGTILDLSVYDSNLEHLFIKNTSVKRITSDDMNLSLPDNINVYV